MPVPIEYKRAGEEFTSFLVDAKNAAGLWSTHVTYTMVEGVFQAFRRRLNVEQAIEFAGVLPIGLRALFVSNWDVGEPKKAFDSRAAMTDEVKSLRPKHNFSTDDAISVVAIALRRHVDEEAFDRILAKLPQGAIDFWQTADFSSDQEKR